VNKLVKTKVLLIIMALLLAFVPQTINQPIQTYMRTLVVAVGVDKEENDYVMSAQVLEANSSQVFQETLQVYSSTGQNILECIENMSLHIGKITGFGNVSVVVFGNDMAEEGIAETLDFFIRSKRLGDNTTVITTDKTAKELLTNVAKIDKSFSYSINNIAKLNAESELSCSSNMLTFLSDYYGGRKASFVSQIQLVEDENMGISTQNMSSSGDGSTQTSASASQGDESQQNSEQDVVISNSGYTSVFVGGKQVAVFSPKEMIGFNTLGEGKRGVYTLTNVNDGFLKNAEVSLSIKSKQNFVDYKFENGIPRAYYKLKYVLKVEQIKQNGTDQIVLDGSRNYVSSEVKEQFVSQVKSQIAESINLAKEYNADLFGVQDAFFRFKNKEWEEYYSKLPNKEDAFKNIEFFADIEVVGNL
jgi:spore germination protein KC